MRQLTPSLWQTETLSPFPGLTTSAYLWTSPEGNVLFYNTTFPAEFDHMAELGGVAHQYLSHRDEVASSLATVRERFGARLHIHKADADEVTQTTVDDPFDTRHTAVAGLEVIPTPGHTPGSACYLATIDGRTHLFTGDTLFRRADGRWMAGYIEGHSDREPLLATLDLLATLTPDVVVSSAFMGDTGVTTLGDRPWADCVAEARTALLASA
ncbi:MBL fold metallo-hydrolase [Nocardia puris]|uniref:Metallo-beta-lactamase superfamily protein n=1 Tax=Nocardia puris TaxID=208602 RepID=A0A366DUH8_9NOCA|nr:MBL fold metallo-hydrolase [Nocardia puris]MBF6210328.1 MBL fold metallo-hydrolase [Nocardia puris]MBF6367403.1 MBL fold metallo-hydrolase [Nocardia puris]MBF6457588.1 MBL fold metallo-hydrolase [Nocardia puris]RBO93751.1 metallo-beta-lactamase superfamily protein [Nocardia puris]